MRRLLSLALSMSLAACATPSRQAGSSCTPPVTWEAPTPAPAPVALTEPAPECDGLELELLVQERESGPDAGWSRRIALRCHAHGATLTYDTSCVDCEIGTETIELAPADTNALWSELRSLSLASLECGPATGARAHRIEITSARGVRLAQCDASETPAAWSALEAILSTARATPDGEPWPYDAEYWRDEIRYASSPP